jgi:phosphopantothenoylcysteine decarboxylase/phosphopantothenate--cysteine ligase
MASLPLEGKKLLLGVSGSIAAYKTAFLCRLLIKSGAEVRIVMTPSAKSFISPLTLSTLSNHQVYSHLIDEDEWSNHVELGLWADLFIIAPATANTLASCAHGLCQNMLHAVYLSAKCPIVFAPAMDRDMWLHPSTQENISRLKVYGHDILDVEFGELASGIVGLGRMSEPETICTQVVEFFRKDETLKGFSVLVNAGPTFEKIDPVRFIGNRSTGKMGIALARELKRRGADVHLVLGPSSLFADDLEPERVESAEEMFSACKKAFSDVNLAVLSAAVADYTPLEYFDSKIKKEKESSDFLDIRLKRTPDIAAILGQMKTNQQKIIGFALETSEGIAHAEGKLSAKNMDMIVLNSLKDHGAGFAHDTNKVRIFSKKGQIFSSDLKPKSEIASDILDTFVQHFL